MSTASATKKKNPEQKVQTIPTKTISRRPAKFFAPVAELIPSTSWKPKTPAERQELLDAFPIADPGDTPVSDRVIIQLRNPLTQSRGGIKLSEQDQEAQLWNEQVARIIATGPTAFHFQRDGSPWPEGEWYDLGEFVRVPSHREGRWPVTVNGKTAFFVAIRSYEILTRIHGSPLHKLNRALGVK